MFPIQETMKHLALLFLALLTWSVNAQITFPYNPDGNDDQYISTIDLQDFLVHYGQDFEPGEVLVDSIPLSAYLDAMEALILANAMPEGTTPGQFLRWNGEAWELVMPQVGCTLPEACNYDPTAHVLDLDKCVLQDACGVCDGPGAIYECGCADLPEGACDCDGNVTDALGVCGGLCEADEDGDGICDDGDACVGEADECGVCNGPGAIYDCGCGPIPEGDCDCDGNVEDVVGVCGGSCTADEDGDGICDDEDDCVGAYDACGVCNGPGPVLGCGCEVIPEGDCDCQGNVLDAVGTCGGACQTDINGDGICDDDTIPGCTYEVACNYDPSAGVNDGSCDFVSCYGCTDITACNYDPSFTIDNGSCWYAEPSYDCDFNCLIDTDGDGVCDDLEIFGCTDTQACNFEPVATELDDSCTYPGCTDEAACNYDADAGCDDGSCLEDAQTGCMDQAACNFDPGALCEDGSCVYPGCNNPDAENYDEAAGCDDGSCVVVGCTVDLACNYDPNANVEDNSCEFGNCPGCNDPSATNYNPTSTNDEACAFEFTFTGSVQTYVASSADTLLVKLWGAQGGDGGPNTYGQGGLGGYAEGFLIVEANQMLSMYVGGEGASYQMSGPGGWNGGGGTAATSNDNKRPGAGGGATDIRLGDGLEGRLIVAAGGGGASGWMSADGGAGGGLTGADGNCPCWSSNYQGRGAGQTYGGSGGSSAPDGGFGYGGSGLGNSHGGGGGGGGWYGGGGGTIDSGGGGSSYIGGVLNGVTTSGVNEGHGRIEIVPHAGSLLQD